MNSVFEIFKIGIGPSSSHTVGPMKIAQMFIKEAFDNGILQECLRVKVNLFGSLGATGRGHSSDKAVVLGLMGNLPQSVDMIEAKKRLKDVIEHKKINLLEIKRVDFDFKEDIVLHATKFLKFHPNGMTLYLYGKDNKLLKEKTYYSIGGGAVVSEDEINNDVDTKSIDLPYSFDSADELLQKCRENSLDISTLMMKNEISFRSEEEVKKGLLEIWQVMRECVQKGCDTTGEMPILCVQKRANKIYKKLQEKAGFAMIDPLEVMDWINLWALAVNEQNACGEKVVTAPTNGAAGIVPAVMHYMNKFLGNTFKEFDEDKVINFLLTAGAIGLLYQKNASISGADVGCQGEVGVACSMAAGALAETMGGSIEQVENAAEIAMEHSLGLTCDPVGGLVQVPCIERNALASVRAVNSARMALNGDGSHFVSLDNVIKTMYETGKDMMSKYKETSQGGLAVNIVEC
ncbi:L-serine ammonia-lyase [Sulfurospirillum sp.]|nr:L-serine ammonia-lyase [Sulfurospirillum sp.]